MAPPKVDSARTHIYTTPSHLRPDYIHIVGDESAHILNSDHDTAD